MKNIVNIKSDLNELQQLAITGFLFGNDNYGEEVIGVKEIITYHTNNNYYSMIVSLKESETHTSTSGVGFYVNTSNDTLTIYSSGSVLTFGITDGIKLLLDKAIIVEH